MVAKFLDDNKPKSHLKREFAVFIDLIQFHLIFQKLAKFSGFESKRAESKFRKKENDNFCVVSEKLSKKAGN